MHCLGVYLCLQNADFLGRRLMQSRNWFLDSPLLVTFAIGDRLHNPTLHNILAFKENVLNRKFKLFHRSKYVFRHASVSSTYRGQPLWALTKRQDSNVVADIVADNVVDMEVDKVADIAADKKNIGRHGVGHGGRHWWKTRWSTRWPTWRPTCS